MAARKKPAKKSTSKQTFDLAKRFKAAEARAEKKTGMGFFSLPEFEAKFGIPGYIPTGVWDLDMMLPHNEDRSQYGVPRGRITEFHGDESSFKSTLCYRIAAETIAQGGRVYWFTTELDFNRAYALENVIEFGVSPDVADEQFRSRPTRTIRDLFTATNEMMSELEDLAGEIEKAGENVLETMPPIMFIIDSIAAFLSGTDHDRLDNDFEDGLQVGGRAGELHRFFQFFMYPMAKIGAGMVFTNQFRANLGFGNKKWNVAHDNTVRYYCSVRVRLKAYDYTPLSGSNKPTRDGQPYTWGRQIDTTVYKMRGDWVSDGETKMLYQYGHGFDYITSAINVLTKTGITVFKNKEFVIDESADSAMAFLNGNHDLKELRRLLKENVSLLPDAMGEAMSRGPIRLEDMR